ncbi:MAG TPA: hypothetical protein VHP37_24045 [Burkholderiales bacterium]|nr:hypothetical protein [Burkholderiales bacterium]
MNAVRAVLDRLGPAGVISLGVLLFCAFFHYSTVRPLERELGAQRSAAERLKSRAPIELSSAPDKADEVRRFYELFPPVAHLPEQLERVYAVAREAGLSIQQGEYRLESRGSGLFAYRLTFPVRGEYARIRQFVGVMLTDMPIASIDALRFERRRVGDTQLEGQVRLSVYFRREGDEEIAASGAAPGFSAPRESAPLPRDSAPPARDTASPRSSAPPAPPPKEEPEL